MTTTMKPFAKELFTLKGLKMYPRLSTDSEAFSATLYFDGKKLADCTDDGNGGCVDVRFLDRSNEKPFYDWIKSQPERRYEADEHMSAFSVPYDDEHLVHDLMNAELERRDWVKVCKKGIVYTREGQDGDSFWTWKVAYTPDNAAKLRAKFGDVTEIINERFIP